MKDIGQLYVFDFETYFDKDYTLTKMTTESYVRDERFEAIGLGVVNGTDRLWIEGPDIPAFLDGIDWSKCYALAHHAQFDGLILSHVYRKSPRYWFDTLSMARALLGVYISISLDALTKYFDLPAKQVPYDLFRGKHTRELDRSTLNMIGRGCVHDAELCKQIFFKLAPAFPQGELDLIDLTVRMFTEPVLEADLNELGRIWTDENKRRHGALASLGVDEKELQSNVRLIELLEEAGVTVAYKTGKTGPIPCFARTDSFMEELLEHANEYVQGLARARLGLRSTIDQSRAERLGDMATRGRLPVYLRYAGAHTLRWSGGDRVNWQNFRRGGRIRKTICAPSKGALVIVDSSQIECRLLNTWAGQDDIVERFRRKEDPYINTATIAYGRPITKQDVAERGTGKQLELSCGYGAGALTIQRTARLGTYGPPVKIDLQEAERWKQIYRQTHPAVVHLWHEADYMLKVMEAGGTDYDWRGMEMTGKSLRLPGQLDLIYETLEWDQEKAGWFITTRHGQRSKMYGAKLVENVIQYMARMYLADAMLKICNSNIRIVAHTHDEIVALAHESEAELARDIMVEAMTTAPPWMPDLPLDAEAIISDRYEK